MMGGLFVGQTFEITENERGSEAFGEAFELERKFGPEGLITRVTSTAIRRGRIGHHVAPWAFVTSSAGGSGLGLAGDPNGDAKEPASHGTSPTDRTSATGQDEKHRLSRVFRLVRVVEQAATEPQDHRTMPIDEAPECGRRPGVGTVHELFQQFPVGQGTERSGLK